MMALVQAASPAARQDLLHRRAAELEAAFLSEMLAHAGFDVAAGSFGGGIGEQQLASLLRGEQAAAMVRAGGLGLAESLFRAMDRGAAHDF
ncbi:chemotaxis protein chel [Cereibacter changlensis JA139]|uniref:Chemotaxis protein chel n=2 Tax=Cereibacter changlensis TaxID=402884 RepID=A0A2T4JYI9_9RHOB|nr:rod-binding protein [Cereibacter changlensis]PTE22981.1 chemotaxis protein chel [Cereibacter changlensis JA139]PZX58848.1 rod binding protein [Cereibacter changlensis]